MMYKYCQEKASVDQSWDLNGLREEGSKEHRYFFDMEHLTVFQGV